MHNGTTSAMLEFDKWSRSYDRSILQKLIFRPSHNLLLSHLTAKDQMVLDIGCGTSILAERIVQKFPNTIVTGLDLSSEMLRHSMVRRELAQKHMPVVRGDSEQLPFRDNTFDVITCSNSFHHYPHQDRVVAEMFRVLKPDGRLMIIDGDRDRFWGWFIFDVMVTWIEGAVHHCSGKRFQNLYRGAGFERVEQQRRGIMAPFMLTIGYASKPAVPARKAA